MDILQLTTADLIELEEKSGYSLGDVLKLASDIDVTAGILPPARAMAALMFIAARVSDPAVEWDDVLKRPMADFTTALDAISAAPDPS